MNNKGIIIINAIIITCSFGLFFHERTFIENAIDFSIAYFVFFCIVHNVVGRIIHELGHWFFGKLAGFELIRISTCGFAFDAHKKECSYGKENKDQCLMIQKSEGKYKCKAYCMLLAGGFILNILCAVLCFLGYIFCENTYIELFFLAGSAVELVHFCNNAIPINDVEQLNDGQCIWYINKDEIQFNMLFFQMKIAGSLSKSLMIGMDDLIKNIDNCQYENKLSYFCRYNNYYIALRNGEYELALKIINRMFDVRHCYGKTENTQIILEKLFLLSLFRKKEEANILIEELDYKYVNINTFDYIRVIWLYEKNVNNNIQVSKKLFEKLGLFDYSNADEYVRIMLKLINNIDGEYNISADK